MQGAQPPVYPPDPYPAGPYSQPPVAGRLPANAEPPAFSGGPQGAPPAALDAPGAASLALDLDVADAIPAVRAARPTCRMAGFRSGASARSIQQQTRSIPRV